MFERIVGTTRWFSARLGYGFIRKDDGEEIFVHYSAIQTPGYKRLREGQKVEFRIEEGEKGYQAAEVVPVED